MTRGPQIKSINQDTGSMITRDQKVYYYSRDPADQYVGI